MTTSCLDNNKLNLHTNQTETKKLKKKSEQNRNEN